METWEVWYPDAAADGLLPARGTCDSTQALGYTLRRSCCAWRYGMTPDSAAHIVIRLVVVIASSIVCYNSIRREPVLRGARGAGCPKRYS